eukprot:gene13385-biopygen9557
MRRKNAAGCSAPAATPLPRHSQMRLRVQPLPPCFDAAGCGPMLARSTVKYAGRNGSGRAPDASRTRPTG